MNSVSRLRTLQDLVSHANPLDLSSPNLNTVSCDLYVRVLSVYDI